MMALCWLGDSDKPLSECIYVSLGLNELSFYPESSSNFHAGSNQLLVLADGYMELGAL